MSDNKDLPATHWMNPKALKAIEGEDSDHLGCLPDIVMCVDILKIFTFEFQNEAGIYDDSVNPQILGNILRVHADTLERLEIASSNNCFPDDLLFGSLAKYMKLKRLAIPEAILILQPDESDNLLNVLPPNLEHLQLQYTIDINNRYPAICISRLEQLAAVKTVRFAALKRVIFWQQPVDPWFDDSETTPNRPNATSDMDKLTATFCEVNVEFEWLYEFYFRSTLFQDEEDWNWWGSGQVYH